MLTTSARPKTFDEVAGQEIPKKLLQAIIKNPETSPHSIILCGPWGLGKCVLPETRVATSEGYLKIKDLLVAEEGFTDYVTEVETRYGKKLSSHFYKQKKCKVNLLHLKNGEDINGTDAHRVLAYHDSKVDLWRTDVLEKGDYILFPKKSVGENWKRNVDLAYAVGLWLGDGFYSKTMGFCGTYDMCYKFARICNWSGAITQDKRKENLYTVRPVKTDNVLFELKEHSDTKEIPEYIFTLDYDSRVAFVQGLLETDGTISKYGSVEWTMKSKKLIKQLLELLHTLGITAKYTEKMVKYKGEERIFYRLRIPSSQSGSLNLMKNGRDFSHKDSVNDRNIIKVDGEYISSVIRAHRIKFPFRNKGDVGSQLSSNAKLFNAITERSLIKYKEFYGELPLELEGLIGYTYVEITGKSEIFSDVYDLTVPDVHEFYCQGTFNHNTTSARIFAVELNHMKYEDLDNSPFYVEYDASQLKLDSLRQTIETWYAFPSGGYRVIVFDECHLLDKKQQSALLKVIEDGIKNTFFIFATTDVDKVLNTIRSRSLEIRLSLIPKESACERIREVAKQNNILLDEEVVERIYKVSKGHGRDMMMALDKYSMLGKEAYMGLYVSCTDCIESYFTSFSDKDKLFAAIDSILQFPLYTIKDDFDNYILQLCKDMTYGKLTPVIQYFKQNTLKLIKITMQDWFRSSFQSDVELQSALLCLYQMMIQSSVQPTVTRANPNARR